MSCGRPSPVKSAPGVGLVSRNMCKLTASLKGHALRDLHAADSSLLDPDWSLHVEDSTMWARRQPSKDRKCVFDRLPTSPGLPLVGLPPDALSYDASCCHIHTAAQQACLSSVWAGGPTCGIHTDALASDDVSCNSSHHGLLTKGVASLRLTFSIKQWLRETGLEHQPGPRRKFGSAAVLTFRKGLRNSSKDLPTHAFSIDSPTARQQQVIHASTPTSQDSASPPLLTHLLLLASHHPSSGSPLSPKMSHPLPLTLLA